MKLKLALIVAALIAGLWLVAGTENTIVKFGPADALTDSGIFQPGPGNYEFGPYYWGTIIIRVPDNTNTTGTVNGGHLMILAGQPGQAVSQPGASDADGGSVTIQGGDGVGTNGYGGSVSIYGGHPSGTGVPGIVYLVAPTTLLSGTLAFETNGVQAIFGGVASAPNKAAQPAAWVAVQVAGDTNEYRVPLFK